MGILPQPLTEEKQDPNFSIMPQYWVDKNEVENRLAGIWDKQWLVGFRDVTSAISQRTSIFSIMPRIGVGHNAPLLIIDIIEIQLSSCILANLNSIVFDYITRQKIAGNHLSFFVLKQLPIIPPAGYVQSDVDFILARVLELVYTTNDLQPFAKDMGYDGLPFKWNEERRALLRAELDAYYAKLYGLTRDELRYILDPQDIYGPNFPGETFRVLKAKEIKQYGEYRTRRLVLEAWDRLFGGK